MNSKFSALITSTSARHIISTKFGQGFSTVIGWLLIPRDHSALEFLCNLCSIVMKCCFLSRVAIKPLSIEWSGSIAASFVVNSYPLQPRFCFVDNFYRIDRHFFVSNLLSGHPFDFLVFCHWDFHGPIVSTQNISHGSISNALSFVGVFLQLILGNLLSWHESQVFTWIFMLFLIPFQEKICFIVRCTRSPPDCFKFSWCQLISSSWKVDGAMIFPASIARNVVSPHFSIIASLKYYLL